MSTRHWYVDATRTPVVWGDAVVDDVAAEQIDEVVAYDDNPAQGVVTYVWARPGQYVQPGRVAAAQAIEEDPPVPPALEDLDQPDGGDGGDVTVTNEVEVKNDTGNPLAVSSPTRQLLLDYAARTDTNPVYLGKAPTGSGTDDPVWTVYKFDYDGSARLVNLDYRSSLAWDDRADPTPAWGF